MLDARTEPGIERRGDHRRGDGFVDRRFDGPAALAAVGHIAFEVFQVRRFGQRDSSEIEHPGGNPPAPPPYFGDIGGIDGEAFVLWQFLAGAAAQNVETFGVSLHQAIFDAVMNHFDEMTGAYRSGMHVALNNARVASLTPRCLVDVALAWRQGREDGVEPRDGIFV